MVAEYQVLNFGFDQNRFQKLSVVTQHSLSFFLLSCLENLDFPLSQNSKKWPF